MRPGPASCLPWHLEVGLDLLSPRGASAHVRLLPDSLCISYLFWCLWLTSMAFFHLCIASMGLGLFGLWERIWRVRPNTFWVEHCWRLGDGFIIHTTARLPGFKPVWIFSS